MNEKTKKSRKIKPFTDDGFLNEDYLFHAIGYSEREEHDPFIISNWDLTCLIHELRLKRHGDTAVDRIKDKLDDLNIFDEEIYFDEEKTVEQILSQKIKPKIKKLSNGLDNWRYVNEEDKKDYDILLECSKKLEQLVKLGYRKKRLRYEDSSLENSVFGF